MNIRVTHRVACVLPLILLAALPAMAQDPSDKHQCQPDELDMGDFCVSRSPEARRLEPGARRETPYRVRSLMPGHAGEPVDQPGPELAGGAAAAEQAQGWGVQFGVFSSRETAVSVAREAAEAVGGPFHLAPMERGERILWACINGPFSDENTALAARERLQASTGHAEAFVKPLDKLKLVELDHATTQK